TNSKLSPRFPNVINDERRTANGKASGTSAAVSYQINSKITAVRNPLPTKSSIHNQKNCITNTRSVIKKVEINGPINAFTTNMSSFLIKPNSFQIYELRFTIYE